MREENAKYPEINAYYGRLMTEVSTMMRRWQKAQVLSFGTAFGVFVLLGLNGEFMPKSPSQRAHCQEAICQPLRQTELIAIDAEPMELARKLIQSAREATSLVEILKRGDRKRALVRALSILEKNHISGSLWLLLVAWWCQVEGDVEVAKASLKALKEAWKGERVAPMMTGWQADVAAFILGELSEVDDEIAHIASVMLTDGEKSKVVQAWTKRGFFSQALKLTEMEKAEWQRGHDFAYIAVALVKANRFEEAIKMAKSLPNTSERLFVLARTAHAMAEAGQNVSSLLDELKEATKGLKDAGFLLEIAFVFSRLGRDDEALKLAQRFSGDERAQIVSEIIKALSQRQDLERAMELLKLPEFERGMGVWFKGEAIVAIAKALAQLGRLDDAQQIVKQVPLHHFDGLITIAKVAAEQGKKTVAEEIFSKLLAKATYWGEVLKIAFAQAEAGLDATLAFEKAIDILKRESEKLQEWRPNPLVETVIRMVSHGLMERAMEIVKLIKKTSDKSEALVNVAIGMARRGDLQAALQYFGQAILEEETYMVQYKADEVLEFLTKEMVQRKMVKEATQIAELVNSELLRSRALAEVARAKVESGQLEEALSLAQKVHTSHELVYIAEAIAKIGRIEDAVKILAQIKDANERDQALYQLTKQVAEYGKFKDAFIIVHAIQKAEKRTDALGAIANLMSKVGRFSEAFKIAQKIEHSGFRASVLTSIIMQMTEAGKTEEALKVAKAERDTETRGEMLRGIALILAFRGQWQKAIQIAKEIPDEMTYLLWLSWAVETAHAQKRPETLSLVRQLRIIASRRKEPAELATAAKVLAMMGRTKEADQVFGEAIKVARNIKDELVRSNVFQFISTNLAEVGKFDQAVKLALEISDEEDRLEAARFVLGEMVEAGKIDAAIRYASYFSKEHWDDLLVHLATVYNSVPIARAVKNIAKRAEALKEIAKDFYWREHWEKGKRKEAEKVFDEALMTAQQIPDHAQRVKLFWEIAIALAQTGFHEKAVSLAENLPFMMGEYLPIILRILAGEGEWDFCKRLISFCQEDWMLACEGCLAIARLFPKYSVEIARLISGNSLKER